jgi:hypothetical protein
MGGFRASLLIKQVAKRLIELSRRFLPPWTIEGAALASF